jgi:AsnC-like helix-turn-helix protein
MDGERTIDAYVFVKDAPEGFLGNLLGLVEAGETTIRYAAALTGGDDAIAALEVSDLGELEAVIDQNFRATPAMTTSTAIGLCPPPPFDCDMPRKIMSDLPIEVFVRLWVQPGRAATVVADLLAIDGIDEAGVMAGDFDVLTVFSVATFDQAIARLLDQVHRVPSIVRTSTAFVIRSARGPKPAQA